MKAPCSQWVPPGRTHSRRRSFHPNRAVVAGFAGSGTEAGVFAGALGGAWNWRVNMPGSSLRTEEGETEGASDNGEEGIGYVGRGAALGALENDWALNSRVNSPSIGRARCGCS